MRVTVDAREVKLVRAANGLLYPTDPKLAELGAPRDLTPVKRAETGVGWYPKLLEPAPVAQNERVDFFGNGTTYFSIGNPHDRLVVTARSQVRVAPSVLP